SANGTSTVAIPAGNLTLNSANVTLTAAGEINQNVNLTINGDSVLTLSGSNTFNNTINFVNSGGIATPSITAGTLVLGGSAGINSTNDSFSFTPTIFSAVSLGSATRTITTGGLSPVSMIMSGVISGTAGAGLTKQGAGALVLSGANTFTGGV